MPGSPLKRAQVEEEIPVQLLCRYRRLTTLQMRLFLLIASNGRRGCMESDGSLAAILGCLSKGRVSQALAVLVRKGVIASTEDEKGRRVLHFENEAR
jgi:hypothetical protein